MEPSSFDQSAPAPLFMGWSNLLQGSGSSAPHRMHCQVPMHSASEPLPDNCLLLSVTTGVFMKYTLEPRFRNTVSTTTSGKGD